ncbi:MAG: cell division topological specificity factor MinE [candidate division Zixibacteria bacterium]|nr:cell division topological specificity factor MinE [candidate division Zixibacteria bacterium]
MINILRLFQRHEEKAGAIAKRRLQLVLTNNRVALTPDLMERLRQDIFEVVSRYFEIDAESTRFDVERSDDEMALVSSIGIKRVLRESESHPA